MENYYPKKSMWKWILLYLAIGAVAYGLIYYFFFSKNGGYNSQNYQTQTQNVETKNWKTYTNDEGRFSLQYPPHWEELDGAKNDQSMKNIIFFGDEGDMQVFYGQGFGGMCPQGYEKILIGNEQFDVCHYINNGVKGYGYEEWAVSGKEFGSIGVAMFATANKPYLSNRATILKIFSTFKFTK